MFTLEMADVSRAIERVKQFHPKVKMVRFGEYEVTGSNGSHRVRCYRDERGRKAVECDCLTRDGLACRCGVAAVSLHVAVAAMRAA